MPDDNGNPLICVYGLGYYDLGQQNNGKYELQILNNYWDLNKYPDSWVLFLPHGTEITDPNTLREIAEEIEPSVAMYFNYFVSVEKPKSKILTFFETYKKERIKRAEHIINTAIIVESKLVKDFDFNPSISILKLFELILYLTDKCILRRSSIIIDSVKLQNNNPKQIESDLKILNEQSRPQPVGT